MNSRTKRPRNIIHSAIFPLHVSFTSNSQQPFNFHIILKASQHPLSLALKACFQPFYHGEWPQSLLANPSGCFRRCCLVYTKLLLRSEAVVKEPPLFPHPVPYIGHILGLLRHGTRYYEMTRSVALLLSGAEVSYTSTYVMQCEM